MTTVQFLVLLLIFAVFIMLIGTMLHRTYSYNLTSLRIIDCQNMYSNMTLMNMCFSKFRAEIDP